MESIKAGWLGFPIAYIFAMCCDWFVVSKAAKGFAMGCPAMGAEVLEEGEMEPFVCDVEGFAAGKTIALFGSYGWGDGQWMRDWEARMSGAGATIVGGEGVICQEAPDADAIEQCKALGKALANA